MERCVYDVRPLSDITSLHPLLWSSHILQMFGQRLPIILVCICSAMLEEMRRVQARALLCQIKVLYISFISASQFQLPGGDPKDSGYH